MRKRRLWRPVGLRSFGAKASPKSKSALRAEQLESRLLLSVNDLVWNGTSGADQVLFEQVDATTIRVTESLLNGAAVNNVTVYAGIDGRVIASGLGGNDLLDASGLTTTQSTLDGGAGSNTLRGGAAADLLIGGTNGGEGAQASHTISGGAGDDTIYGNAQVGAEGSRGGNHLILGGAGNDTIYGAYGSVEKSNGDPSNGGEGGQNLIVGGTGSDTIYASQTGDGAEGGHSSILVAGDSTLDEAELSTLLSEWTSTRTLSEKLDNIAGVGSGPRNNGDNFLQVGVTLFSDHAADQLFSDTNGAANWLIDTAGDDASSRVKAADIHDDVQVGQAIWINPSGGFWDEAANWQDGYLPGPNDIAVLNAGSNTITFRSGAVTVQGIQAASPLALTGGSLTVDGDLVLPQSLTMTSGNLSVDGSLAVAGAVSLSLTIGTVSLSVTGDMYAQNALSWAGGNFNVGGNLTIDGAAVGTSGTLSVGGDLVMHNTLTIGRTVTTTSSWPFGGTTVTVTPSNLNVAGNLEMHNTLIFNGGTLHNATLVMLDGAQLSVPVMRHSYSTIVGTTVTVQDTSGTLDNVTIDSDVDFSGSSPYSSGGTGISYFFSYLTVTGDLTLNANLTLGGTSYGRLRFSDSSVQTLAGTGSVTFGPYRSTYGSSSRNSLTGSFTIGPDIEIHGEWGTISGFSTSHSVVNQGTISADVSGASFTLGGTGSFVNQGQIQASTGTSIKLSGFSNVGTITAVAGSTLSLGDSVDLPWSNSGTITANGTTLNLGGTFDAAAMGSLATAGATISLTGTYTGDLNLNATTGSWRLAGGTLKNGTLTESGGARLIFTNAGGIFDSVTLPSGLDLTKDNDAELRIVSAFSLSGPITIGNAAGTTFAALVLGTGSTAPTLPAGLEIILGGSASNGVYNGLTASGAGGTLALPADLLIHGKSGKVNNGSSSGTLINLGSISADVAGGKIVVGGTSAFQNQGILTAQNGDTLALAGTWTNSGTINALAASTVELGGTIDTTALINNVGGTVKLTGTWNGNLSLDGSTGSWQLAGGTLKNGALTESGGARLMFTSAGGTFDGVTLAGGLDLSQDSGAKLTIKNALTLGGPISIGNAAGTTSAILQFATGTSAPSVPAGTVIEFGGSAGNTLVNLASGSGAAGTLTIPASVTLRGKSGMLFNNSSSGTILLQGLLDVDVAGGTWYLGTGGNFVNQGTIQSVQSTLRIEGAWNSGLGSFSAPTADVKLVGTLVGDLTLDGSNGAWTMVGGTLKNGTLIQDGLNRMAFSNNGGAFDNVAVAGLLDLRQSNSAFLTIKNSFSTDSPIYLGNAEGTTRGELTFGAGSAPYSLPLGLEIIFGGATSNKIINGLSGTGANGTLTILAGVFIHGKSGSIESPSGLRSIVNQGTISADVAGGTISIASLGGFVNQGTVQAAGGAITAKFSAPNEGIVAAIAGSTLTISGAYTQAATGTTRIEIAGTAPSQVGKVNVSGAATLAGLLQVVYAGGFSPANNDAFNVLGYASRTGAFDTVDGSGVTFTPAYGPTVLTLTAVVP